MWHKGLFSKLENLNIGGKFLEIIKDLYVNSKCAVKIQNKVTNFFLCNRGKTRGKTRLSIESYLFNIYINDLAFNLDDSNPSPLKLPNGTHISCLMYADDVILIASTPVELQNLLDTVNGFCTDWRLTVNAIKSKCITFSRKNKKNKKNIFTIGDNPLENVCQFTYLGVDISASGSLKASMDSLCTKANRAKYALNIIAKFKRITVKTAIRLFDATILAFLTYGSEIWALNSTPDYDKWDSCPPPEKSHLDFIRYILGTNGSVNNLMCRAELGRYPLCIEINCRVVIFYKHIKEMPKDSISTKLF